MRRHTELYQKIRAVESANDRRFTVAEKLDLMRCIQILKRCARLREQMRKDVLEYLAPQASSYDLSVHEQYQTVMTIMTQGLQDRYGTVDRILTSRSRKAVLGLFHSHVHTRL